MSSDSEQDSTENAAFDVDDLVKQENEESDTGFVAQLRRTGKRKGYADDELVPVKKSRSKSFSGYQNGDGNEAEAEEEQADEEANDDGEDDDNGGNDNGNDDENEGSKNDFSIPSRIQENENGELVVIPGSRVATPPPPTEGYRIETAKTWMDFRNAKCAPVKWDARSKEKFLEASRHFGSDFSRIVTFLEANGIRRTRDQVKSYHKRMDKGSFTAPMIRAAMQSRIYSDGTAKDLEIRVKIEADDSPPSEGQENEADLETEYQPTIKTETDPSHAPK